MLAVSCYSQSVYHRLPDIEGNLRKILQSYTPRYPKEAIE